VDVLKGETKSDAYRAINANCAVPYLQTSTGEGVGESNAMLWLVADGSDLMPRDALERARSLQWMFFEQSKLEPFISPARFLSFIAPDLGKGREADIATWRERALAGLSILDRHLQDRAFMISERYGITDIAMFGYVHVADEAGIDMKTFPAIIAWMERVTRTKGFIPLSGLCDGSKPFVSASR
jgi:glutathione S-transferase